MRDVTLRCTTRIGYNAFIAKRRRYNFISTMPNNAAHTEGAQTCVCLLPKAGQAYNSAVIKG